MRWSLALLVLVLSAACLLVQQSKHDPVVVVDDWWNVDMAKEDCRMREANGQIRCIGDPTAKVRAYEAKLGTFFAVDPLCHGIILTRFEGPHQDAPKAVTKMDWKLMIDFLPGEALQGWTLIPALGSGHNEALKTGKGNPQEMAHSICATIKKVGGLVLD